MTGDVVGLKELEAAREEIRAESKDFIARFPEPMSTQARCTNVPRPDGRPNRCLSSVRRRASTA